MQLKNSKKHVKQNVISFVFTYHKNINGKMPDKQFEKQVGNS